MTMQERIVGATAQTLVAVLGAAPRCSRGSSTASRPLLPPGCCHCQERMHTATGLAPMHVHDMLAWSCTAKHACPARNAAPCDISHISSDQPFAACRYRSVTFGACLFAVPSQSAECLQQASHQPCPWRAWAPCLQRTALCHSMAPACLLHDLSTRNGLRHVAPASHVMLSSAMSGGGRALVQLPVGAHGRVARPNRRQALATLRCCMLQETEQQQALLAAGHLEGPSWQA
jgi:hypothetical protein